MAADDAAHFGLLQAMRTDDIVNLGGRHKTALKHPPFSGEQRNQREADCAGDVASLPFHEVNLFAILIAWVQTQHTHAS